MGEARKSFFKGLAANAYRSYPDRPPLRRRILDGHVRLLLLIVFHIQFLTDLSSHPDSSNFGKHWTAAQYVTLISLVVALQRQ